MSDEIKSDLVAPFTELAPVLGDTPIPPAAGLASVALAMAMKFHDINTVHDGVLYQQYKLEGKNMVPLHLDMVFETAIRIEKHLLHASKRFANIVVDAVESNLSDAIAMELADEVHDEQPPV